MTFFASASVGWIESLGADDINQKCGYIYIHIYMHMHTHKLLLYLSDSAGSLAESGSVVWSIIVFEMGFSVKGESNSVFSHHLSLSLHQLPSLYIFSSFFLVPLHLVVLFQPGIDVSDARDSSSNWIFDGCIFFLSFLRSLLYSCFIFSFLLKANPWPEKEWERDEIQTVHTTFCPS